MPATRGGFAQLLAPGLREIIFDELESLPEEYSQIFNVYPSSSAFEEDQLVAGLGKILKKPEGEPIKMDEPLEGGSYRYTHESWGLGFQVTHEMWSDDKYGIMQRVSKDFANGIRETIESTNADVINNQFTTTTTIDGVTLASTAHPLLGGGTYSNRSATDIAFSVSGLQELILLFEGIVNERGLKKRMIPEGVLIPPGLQFVAGEILHSSYKPYTGNNEINVMQGRLTPMTNHYLTSTTAWSVFAARSRHWLKMFWREQPVYDSQDDFLTKGASFSVYLRFSTGVSYWHGWAASNGA